MNQDFADLTVRTLPRALIPSGKYIALVICSLLLLLVAAAAVTPSAYRGATAGVIILCALVVLARIQYKFWRYQMKCGKCSSELGQCIPTSGKHGEPLLYPCGKRRILWFAGSDFVE